MDSNLIDVFAKIEQPPRESFGFLADLKRPLEYHFKAGHGLPAGKTAGCLAKGVELQISEQLQELVPETALVSFRRVLAAKSINEAVGSYPVIFQLNNSFEHEEYRVDTNEERALITAADCDGFRRAIYFLEERICEVEGASVTAGIWQRKPFMKHRISRCFFGPTNRPPFYIDELMNDVDYYPEEYLNKLAHEGINGLWLTMYFWHLPSSVFPGRGADAPKRLAKLRLTVERCARYGIRIYVFCSEPKRFGDGFSFATPYKDAKEHPELIGLKFGPHKDDFGLFCLSTEAGRRYMEESVEQIFSAVPKLGGLINIMMGEDNGACAALALNHDGEDVQGECPRCSKRDYAEILCEMAQHLASIMHKYNPAAEYIGWFYAPGLRDGGELSTRLLHVVEKWPDNASIMFNFESGSASMQLGKKRRVFDYSLAFPGPSQLFADASEHAPRMGAKLQVGCSHEDASVPFIPVPENLYEKYSFMEKHGVSAAMQCWYFGNYPGLMNKAAGELSFTPFPTSAMEFLEQLARPEWQQDAPAIAEAWHCFSKAYQQFPSNLSFAWFGPLHHCIAWPLHLFPVDAPLAPSWILKNFPEVSGDRIGECLGYQHTLKEGLELCERMDASWQKGVAIMKGVAHNYADNPARLNDISLAEAVGLQIQSAAHVLRFYYLREEMLYEKRDNLAEMHSIVLAEIDASRRMLQLCMQDSRLGYHSEAEGYLFFPEKLEARIKLLQSLLDVDFPKFSLNDCWVDEYTGRTPKGAVAVLHRVGSCQEECYYMGDAASWSGSYNDDSIFLTIHGIQGKSAFIDLVPCRCWPLFRLFVNDKGKLSPWSGTFADIPEIPYEWRGDILHLSIPRKLFDGFCRPGFPMQLNIHGDGFHWLTPHPWPPRLLYSNFNPADTGWLQLK